LTPQLIFISFLSYTILIMIVSWITSRRATNQTFFLGNKASPWFVVAYGMIGASLSGVTFISIPGDVGTNKFSYMMIVFGYLIGYIVIINILLPLYYRMNLTSIYTYLDKRLGFRSYQAGAAFFLLSRTIGASFRMFLVVNVLQLFVFDAWGVPFWLTVVIFIVLIWVYTFRGGIRTIVWTDTLQTTFMLAAVVITIIMISGSLHWSFGEMANRVFHSDFSKMLFTDWHHRHFFIKDFFAGIFIAIVMTGLDQDMMQKNLSCRSLSDAQKNMYWMSSSLVVVNFIFLILGAILYIYADTNGISLPARTDDLFPTIALKYLGASAGIIFIIGIISAAYPSADGALTALTTSFSVDILGINRRNMEEKMRMRIRHIVHICMSLVLLGVVVVFRVINDESVISKLFTIAGYTYGPLLGMFSFGVLTRWEVKDKWVPYIAVLSPVLCYFLSIYDKVLLNGYNFGFELLILNGIFTFAGLFLIRKKHQISNFKQDGEFQI
jgi:Na+/proline symporter